MHRLDMEEKSKRIFKMNPGGQSDLQLRWGGPAQRPAEFLVDRDLSIREHLQICFVNDVRWHGAPGCRYSG
jgi:hypothetical protein